MSVTIDGTSGVTLSSGSVVFPNATSQSSAGNVIQVVQAAYTAQWTGTPGAQSNSPNANMLSTGFTVSITPKFSTSKILLMGQIQGSVGAATSTCDFLFKRGTTIISIGTGATNDNMTTGFYVNGGSDKPWITLPFFVYDTPATTSSTTYTLFALGGNGSTFSLNLRADSWESGVTNLIAMEIAQ